MDSNALLVVLSAVLGLVTFYLRYYTHAQIGDAVEKITDRFRADIQEVRNEIRALSNTVIRLDERSNKRADEREGERANLDAES